MKKTKLLLASIFILWGIMLSCKVDLESIEGSDNIGSLSNRARKSFEERLKNDPILKAYKIEPVWNDAIANDNSLEVPFTIDGKYRVPYMRGNDAVHRGRERLLVIEKGSKFTFRIIRYIPSKLFKGDIKTINAQNLKLSHFYGYVSTIVLGKKKITICSFSDGRMFNKKYGLPKGNKAGRIAGQSCNWQYNEPYVTLGWDGHEVVLNYHIGEYVYVCIEVPDEDNEPDICDINPSICADPCQSNPEGCDPCVINPASCNPCQIDPASCGGDGGSSDITNQLTNDCFKEALANLSSSNFKGKVAEIFQNYNKNPNANFTIKEQIFMGINATFNAYTEGNIITLNTEMLRNASKELIALTILHEMLHVYIGKSELTDHIDTAEKYINPMADYISSVYGLDVNVARSLIWSGLQDTPAWEERTEQQQYQSINNERLHKNLNDFNHGQNGTHCN